MKASTQMNKRTFLALATCKNPIYLPCYQISTFVFPPPSVIHIFTSKRFIHIKTDLGVRYKNLHRFCQAGISFPLSDDKIVTKDNLLSCDPSWVHLVYAYPLLQVKFSPAVPTKNCWYMGNKWKVLASQAFIEAKCTRFLIIYNKQYLQTCVCFFATCSKEAWELREHMQIW